MARLREYAWPGNLRELQSVLKQALLRASGVVLLPGMLPELTAAPATTLPSGVPAGSGLEDFIRKRLAEGSEDLNEEAHRELDRVLLPLVMEHTRGNQFQAAKILGLARQTLRQRLRALHIAPRFTDGGEDGPQEDAD
jgi:two-component system nitrogen regulation response regulator GlnG